MQKERQVSVELGVDVSNARGDTGARERRTKAERRAHDLDEHPIRHDVAIGPTSRAYDADAPRGPQTLLQLEQQPALSRPRFADHENRRTHAGLGVGDTRL